MLTVCLPWEPSVEPVRAGRFCKLYRSLKIWCNKALHQGRVTGQIEMDEDGVPEASASRFCQYDHSDRAKSYLYQLLALAAILQRAHYDHENQSAATSAHTTVISSDLVAIWCPKLLEQEVKLEALLQAVNTKAQMKKQCLKNASCFLRHVRVVLETAIQCEAARPRDETGKIRVQEPPIYQAYAATNRVFQMSFFQSAQFKAFVGLVHAAEEEEINSVPLLNIAINNTQTPGSSPAAKVQCRVCYVAASIT